MYVIQLCLPGSKFKGTQLLTQQLCTDCKKVKISPFQYLLNFCGLYRSLQRNFVDMENMFQLLHESADVNDDPNASIMCVTQGAVEFRNVSFNYLQDQLLLQNVSFKVAAGKTLALVCMSKT